MSGEGDKCGEHALECPLPVPKRWKEEAKEMFPLDVIGIDEEKLERHRPVP